MAKPEATIALVFPFHWQGMNHTVYHGLSDIDVSEYGVPSHVFRKTSMMANVAQYLITAAYAMCVGSESPETCKVVVEALPCAPELGNTYRGLRIIIELPIRASAAARRRFPELTARMDALEGATKTSREEFIEMGRCVARELLKCCVVIEHAVAIGMQVWKDKQLHPLFSAACDGGAVCTGPQILRIIQERVYKGTNSPYYKAGFESVLAPIYKWASDSKQYSKHFNTAKRQHRDEFDTFQAMAPGVLHPGYAKFIQVAITNDVKPIDEFMLWARCIGLHVSPLVDKNFEACADSHTMGVILSTLTLSRWTSYAATAHAMSESLMVDPRLSDPEQYQRIFFSETHGPEGPYRRPTADAIRVVGYSAGNIKTLALPCWQTKVLLLEQAGQHSLAANMTRQGLSFSNSMTYSMAVAEYESNTSGLAAQLQAHGLFKKHTLEMYYSSLRMRYVFALMSASRMRIKSSRGREISLLPVLVSGHTMNIPPCTIPFNCYNGHTHTGFSSAFTVTYCSSMANRVAQPMCITNAMDYTKGYINRCLYMWANHTESRSLQAVANYHRETSQLHRVHRHTSKAVVDAPALDLHDMVDDDDDDSEEEVVPFAPRRLQKRRREPVEDEKIDEDEDGKEAAEQLERDLDPTVFTGAYFRRPLCRDLPCLEQFISSMMDGTVELGYRRIPHVVVGSVLAMHTSALDIDAAMHCLLSGPTTCGKTHALEAAGKFMVPGTVLASSTSALAFHRNSETPRCGVQEMQEVGSETFGDMSQYVDSDSKSKSSQLVLSVAEKPYVMRETRDKVGGSTSDDHESEEWGTNLSVSNTQFSLQMTTNENRIPAAHAARWFIRYLEVMNHSDASSVNVANPHFSTSLSRFLYMIAAIYSATSRSVPVIPETELMVARLVMHQYKQELVTQMAILKNGDAMRSEADTEADPTANMTGPTVGDGMDCEPMSTRDYNGYTDAATRQAGGAGSPQTNQPNGAQPSKIQDRGINEVFSPRHEKAVRHLVSLTSFWSRYLFISGWMAPVFKSCSLHELFVVASAWNVATVGQTLSTIVASVPHDMGSSAQTFQIVNNTILDSIVRFLHQSLLLEYTIRCHMVGREPEVTYCKINGDRDATYVVPTLEALWSYVFRCNHQKLKSFFHRPHSVTSPEYRWILYLALQYHHDCFASLDDVPSTVALHSPRWCEVSARVMVECLHRLGPCIERVALEQAEDDTSVTRRLLAHDLWLKADSRMTTLDPSSTFCTPRAVTEVLARVERWRKDRGSNGPMDICEDSGGQDTQIHRTTSSHRVSCYTSVVSQWIAEPPVRSGTQYLTQLQLDNGEIKDADQWVDDSELDLLGTVLSGRADSVSHSHGPQPPASAPASEDESVEEVRNKRRRVRKCLGNLRAHVSPMCSAHPCGMQMDDKGYWTLLNDMERDGIMNVFAMSNLIRINIGRTLRAANNMRQKIVDGLGASLQDSLNIQTHQEKFLNDPEDEMYTTGSIDGCQPQALFEMKAGLSDALIKHLRSCGFQGSVITGRRSIYDSLLEFRERMEAPLIKGARHVIATACTEWISEQHNLQETPEMLESKGVLNGIKNMSKAIENALKYPNRQVETWCMIMNKDITDLPSYEELHSSKSSGRRNEAINIWADSGPGVASSSIDDIVLRAAKRRRTVMLQPTDVPAAERTRMQAEEVLRDAEITVQEQGGMRPTDPLYSWACGEAAQAAMNRMQTHMSHEQQDIIGDRNARLNLSDASSRRVSDAIAREEGAYQAYVEAMAGQAQRMQAEDGPEDLPALVELFEGEEEQDDAPPAPGSQEDDANEFDI